MKLFVSVLEWMSTGGDFKFNGGAYLFVFVLLMVETSQGNSRPLPRSIAANNGCSDDDYAWMGSADEHMV